VCGGVLQLQLQQGHAARRSPSVSSFTHCVTTARACSH
jgi:hypothetical protein